MWAVSIYWTLKAHLTITIGDLASRFSLPTELANFNNFAWLNLLTRDDCFTFKFFILKNHIKCCDIHQLLNEIIFLINLILQKIISYLTNDTSFTIKFKISIIIINTNVNWSIYFINLQKLPQSDCMNPFMYKHISLWFDVKKFHQ